MPFLFQNGYTSLRLKDHQPSIKVKHIGLQNPVMVFALVQFNHINTNLLLLLLKSVYMVIRHGMLFALQKLN